MTVRYHRLAVRDVRQIFDHYEAEAGKHLADRFFESLLGAVEKAVANPSRFPPSGERLRRANLEGFPYHFLYEQELRGIRVLVVRHHRCHPKYGLRRS